MATDLRRATVGTAVAAVLGLGLAQAAMASDMPTTIESFPKNASDAWVRDALGDMGFNNIGPVKQSGNIYDVTASWEGRPVRLEIDARTGGMKDQNAGDTAISTAGDMDDAHIRSELQKLGYTDIGNIERSGDVIETDAQYRGRTVALEIDADNGGVTREYLVGGNTLEAEDGELGSASEVGTEGEWAIPDPQDTMSEAYLEQQLATLGFTDVRDVQKSGNIYELDARTEDRWVRLRVNGRNGEVSPTEG